MENSIYHRTSILLGKDNIEKLKKSNVLICGVGGVGSYVLEALTRVGVGSITIVDKDIVDVTNINRQLIALNSTIGMDKVEVAKNRCKDINPDININALKIKIPNEVDAGLVIRRKK